MSRLTLCRTRSWLALAAFVCVLLSLLVTRSLRVQPNITAETCNRIELGMTERQVEALVGAPAGDYRSGCDEFVIVLDGESGCMWKGLMYTQKWSSDQGSLTVGFDDRGTVVGYYFTPMDAPPRSRLDRLLTFVRRKCAL